MLRNTLLPLVPAMIVLAAGVTGSVVVVDAHSRSTACTTVQADGDPIDLAVIVNGSHSDVDIDQRTVQSDGQTRVEVGVEFDGESVTVSGESAENGSLVLDVTRNGELVNESVVIDGSENRSVVVHVDRDGTIRFTRNDEVACGEN